MTGGGTTVVCPILRQQQISKMKKITKKMTPMTIPAMAPAAMAPDAGVLSQQKQQPELQVGQERQISQHP